jgi:hypothetical protein
MRGLIGRGHPGATRPGRLGAAMPGDRRTPAASCFDSATRAAAIVLADQVGYRAAAAEIGCAESTLRAWRHRASAKDAARPNRDTESSPTGIAEPADLLILADEARLDAATARQRMHEAMESGRAQDARALGQLVREATDRANGLEAEGRHEREHRLRLEQGQAQLRRDELRLMERLWRLGIEGLGIPWSEQIGAALSVVLRAFTSAPREDGNVHVRMSELAAELAPARAAVHAALLRHLDRDEGSSESSGTSVPLRPPKDDLDALDQDVVREIEQARRGDSDPHELRAGPPQNRGGGSPQNPVAVSPSEAPAEAGLPADVSSAEAATAPPSDGLPGWEELPAEWRRRYSLNPDLGRYEFGNHLRRQERQREEDRRLPRRPSPHQLFRHPGLEGGPGSL